MKGRRNLIAALLAVMPLAAGCGSSSNPITPTTPTTDTLTGTITKNGAVTDTFAVGGPGVVAATITSLTPLSTVQVGFALGTWDGTTCQVVLVNPAGTTGSLLQANASTKGNYCVHLYDTGNVAADTPVSFTVTVLHP
ncbi:MAG TPA: hypothetical protein VL262_11955 [Vicinamibacterales bacterium]|jgi:hypothetical protein|nr:hypothetical protein [Vicinamibacterales bacterium]HTL45044.1 hypothetical protein [Vicinamibacterales bacterium]